jgi:hypothetical protein
MTRDGMLQTSQSWTGSPFFPTGPSTPTSSKAMGSIAFRSTPTEAGKITKLQTSRPLYHSDGLRAFGNKLIMEGETKGNLDLISVDGDNAKIETIKDGFDGPVSLVQAGDQIYVLDVPLRYLLGQEAKDKKAPPPFKATAVPAPKQ